jgi:pyridoxine 5-phosphate synthase
MTTSLPRLGVNIDHIATLRQLRGTPYPDLLTAARLVEKAGGEQITVHLREDRRHIQDQDVIILRRELTVPLNLELAVAPAVVRFAKRVRPDWACLVPEKRKELTTEGGLNLKASPRQIQNAIIDLKKSKIKVSLFIEPDLKTVQLSADWGADAIEIHTGRYCLATQEGLGKKSSEIAKKELERVRKAAVLARSLGLRVHAGHGFDYENVRRVVELETEDRVPLIEEYNIGHAIVCRAALVGLERAVREMISSLRAP